MINSEGVEIKRDLKLPFVGCDKIDSFYSQAGQDIFVLSILNGKRNGFFVDIGCYDPILISNTYLLESKFGWNGILVDSSYSAIEKCKSIRSSNNKFYHADASNIDYKKMFDESNAPHLIDYISLDCDGNATLEALKKLPFSSYEFGVITFEHELYKDGTLYRDASRKFLEEKGYVRLCSDVCNLNNPYEDWYVNNKISENIEISTLFSNNQNWEKILFCE